MMQIHYRLYRKGLIDAQTRLAELEEEKRRRRELARQRALAVRELKRQAKDVLLAFQAQSQYARTRERMLAASGLGGAPASGGGDDYITTPRLDSILWERMISDLGMDPVQVGIPTYQASQFVFI